ncbi:hypothetical protein CHS0354_038352 [Potamilus streckersoni]|uniref:LEM domain-containing protein n=1 Tax=Potamilus streckersoni TaxID=2493646 RepID=A0AAE0VQT8_9BIVA|nr:hypothetical protein CHS0354_038352 [Potamilus streckersoni]
MPPIPEMSNEELRQQLEAYGVNVGPITASTRMFYEKKLQKVMSGGDAPQQVPSSSEEEEDEEQEVEAMDVDPEDSIQINRKPIIIEARRPLPGRQYESTVTHRTTHADTNNSRIRPKDIVTQAEPPEEETNTEAHKSGFSMWIKLIFLLGTIFIVYLVIKNMDPNAENKIPKSIESD